MTQRTFSLVTAVLFSLVALLHAVRLLRGWQVTIDGTVMPVWISWMGSDRGVLGLSRLPIEQDGDEIDSLNRNRGFKWRKIDIPVKTPPWGQAWVNEL